jgi:hypothetical protein
MPRPTSSTALQGVLLPPWTAELRTPGDREGRAAGEG